MCLLSHRWGWPRRRGDKDVQTCVRCGLQRESLVNFDQPRITRTQEGPALTTSEQAATMKVSAASSTA
jgi:hypothetical protein